MRNYQDSILTLPSPTLSSSQSVKFHSFYCLSKNNESRNWIQSPRFSCHSWLSLSKSDCTNVIQIEDPPIIINGCVGQCKRGLRFWQFNAVTLHAKRVGGNSFSAYTCQENEMKVKKTVKKTEKLSPNKHKDNTPTYLFSTTKPCAIDRESKDDHNDVSYSIQHSRGTEIQRGLVHQHKCHLYSMRCIRINRWHFSSHKITQFLCTFFIGRFLTIITNPIFKISFLKVTLNVTLKE